MEAATAADLTQASEIAVRYISLGSRLMYPKAYVSDLTVEKKVMGVWLPALFFGVPLPRRPLIFFRKIGGKVVSLDANWYASAQAEAASTAWTLAV